MPPRKRRKKTQPPLASRGHGGQSFPWHREPVAAPSRRIFSNHLPVNADWYPREVYPLPPAATLSAYIRLIRHRPDVNLDRAFVDNSVRVPLRDVLALVDHRTISPTMQAFGQTANASDANHLIVRATQITDIAAALEPNFSLDHAVESTTVLAILRGRDPMAHLQRSVVFDTGADLVIVPPLLAVLADFEASHQAQPRTIGAGLVAAPGVPIIGRVLEPRGEMRPFFAVGPGQAADLGIFNIEAIAKVWKVITLSVTRLLVDQHRMLVNQHHDQHGDQPVPRWNLSNRANQARFVHCIHDLDFNNLKRVVYDRNLRNLKLSVDGLINQFTDAYIAGADPDPVVLVENVAEDHILERLHRQLLRNHLGQDNWQGLLAIDDLTSFLADGDGALPYADCLPGALYRGHKHDLLIGSIDRVIVDELVNLHEQNLGGNYLDRAVTSLSGVPRFLTYGHLYDALDFNTTRDGIIHALVLAEPGNGTYMHPDVHYVSPSQMRQIVRHPENPLHWAPLQGGRQGPRRYQVSFFVTPWNVTELLYVSMGFVFDNHSNELWLLTPVSGWLYGAGDEIAENLADRTALTEFCSVDAYAELARFWHRFVHGHGHSNAAAPRGPAPRVRLARMPVSAPSGGGGLCQALAIRRILSEPDGPWRVEYGDPTDALDFWGFDWTNVHSWAWNVLLRYLARTPPYYVEPGPRRSPYDVPKRTIAGKDQAYGLAANDDGADNANG